MSTPLKVHLRALFSKSLSYVYQLHQTPYGPFCTSFFYLQRLFDLNIKKLPGENGYVHHPERM